MTKQEVIENIPLLKRKEQSIYKPTDLWTVEDDLLFLKYCPKNLIGVIMTLQGRLTESFNKTKLL
jgi:hypothetical protein